MGSFTTTADNPQPGLNTFKSSGGGAKLDNALLSVLQMAAAQSPYNIIAFSGVADRSSGTTSHPSGHGMDIYLQDPATGKLLTNYAGSGFAKSGTMSSNYGAYEQFAQTARIIQQQQFPQLDNTFRWGGYFGTGNGNSSGPDLMHFDTNTTMKGAMKGSWETGIDPTIAKRYGITSSVGIAKKPELVAQIRGGLIPPANVGGDTQVAAVKPPVVPPAVGYTEPPAPFTGAAGAINAAAASNPLPTAPAVPAAVPRPGVGGQVEQPTVAAPGGGVLSVGGSAGVGNGARGNVQVAPVAAFNGATATAVGNAQPGTSGVIRTVPQAGNVAMPPGVRPSSVPNEVSPAFDGATASAILAATQRPVGGDTKSTAGHVVNVLAHPAGNDVKEGHGAPANVQVVPTNVLSQPKTVQPALVYNPAVAQLQSTLGIKNDGLLGPQTQAAIKSFQAAHGLTVDGIVGPQTIAALNGLKAPVPQPRPIVAATAPTPAQPTNALAAPQTVPLASGTPAVVGSTSVGANGYNYVVNADGSVTNTDTGHTSGTPAATVQAVNPATTAALNQAAAFAYTTNGGGNFGPGLRPY